jgi:ABC-type multidrug transport system fused ATPase/permease subunit
MILTGLKDYATDHAIQESLRTEFKEATVITVAHRLQTIMQSDKIVRRHALLKGVKY